MPAQNRFRSDDCGELCKHLPAQDLSLNSQPAPLLVSEQDSFLANSLAKHPIFGQKVFDHILLTTIHPAGED
jgi:hypothetical protein